MFRFGQTELSPINPADTKQGDSNIDSVPWFCRHKVVLTNFKKLNFSLLLCKEGKKKRHTGKLGISGTTELDGPELKEIPPQKKKNMFHKEWIWILFLFLTTPH